MRTYYDSTMISTFMKCPKLFDYKFNQNLRSRGEAYALTFGILLHSAIEQYWRDRFDNVDHEQAIYNAARLAFNNSWQKLPNLNTVELKRTRFALVRAIVSYFDHYIGEAQESYQLKHVTPMSATLKGETGPAVEINFKLAIKDANEIEAVYCGYIDAIRGEADRVFVADYKTTTKTLNDWYFLNWAIDVQITGYVLAAHMMGFSSIQGGYIDAVQLLENGAEFKLHFVPRSKENLNEFLEDIGYYIAEERRCAREDFYPRNRTACSMFGGCEFIEVCKSPEIARQPILYSNFDEVEPWDPSQPRG